MTTTQALGAAAEARAADHLTAKGLRILDRNYRVRGGEIDLVGLDGASVVFVEVRFRRSGGFGGAAGSITAAKRSRIVLAARHWLMAHDRHQHSPCRFDCVLIDGDRIDWIRDAFSAD